jgi:hypothetical protein
MRHRFINDGRSPIPMGTTADYSCVCGKRGSYAVIEKHIIEASSEDVGDAIPAMPYDQIEIDDFGGDTKANYLPSEPRRPAPTGESPPLPRPGTPEPLPPPPTVAHEHEDACLRCGNAKSICTLPEISVWACGHWILKRQRSIAESFQDMLRIAYQAGAASASTGEAFETWYQREVLQ